MMDMMDKIVDKLNSLNTNFLKSFDSLVKKEHTTTVATIGLAGITTIIVFNQVIGTNPIGRTLSLFSVFSKQENKRQIVVDDMIEGYNTLHNDSATGLGERNEKYTTLVNSYYELATSFYEWGWGQSFHFSYQLKGESFDTATKRHEYYIAGRLGVKAGDKVLDVGCGIGGPMRNIARFTRAQIKGVTLNEYQVLRGNELNTQAGLKQLSLAESIQADFMKLPFPNESFDGVYAIEATCHAPRREDVYGEIYRVLKPGQMFACYEWCLTPLYDKNNEYHRLIKKKIEEGDGLPDMATQDDVVNSLASVGFQVIESRDMALDDTFGGQPWWLHLYPSYNPFSFRFQLSPVGKFITRNLLWIFEFIRLVPSGTYKVQEMLQQGGWGCAEGGYTGAFTPMFLMVARKPLN